MLRMLKRGPVLHALESIGCSPAFPSVSSAIGSMTTGQPLLSSSTGVLISGSSMMYSSCSRKGKGDTLLTWKPGGIVSSLQFDKNSALLTNRVGSVISEQNRDYWGKEGRIGWRRRRAREMQQREQLLNPSSPVIDQRVPWPKDDMESLPPDLFEERKQELTIQELMNAQNAIVSSINNQINSETEGRLFAVVHVSGKQFKVTPEDIIIVQDTFFPTAGDQIRLHKVLMVGGKDFTLLGCPLLDPDLVRVEATVIEKTLSHTKLKFRMLKRQNYRRMRFVKTPYTLLRINMVEMMQPLNMVKSDSEPESQQSSNS